jgi:hypothetical protein
MPRGIDRHRESGSRDSCSELGVAERFEVRFMKTILALAVQVMSAATLARPWHALDICRLPSILSKEVMNGL